MLTGLLRASIAGCALLLVIGHLGGLHLVFDSFAVFRLHALIVLGLLLVLSFRVSMPILRPFAGLAAILSVITIAPFVRDLRNYPMDADWRLYQHNMFFRNQNPVDIAQYIIDNKPEFVTLQEVSRRNMAVLQPLRQLYPTWLECRLHTGVATVLMSRYRLAEGRMATCDELEKLGWATLQTPAGQVTLVSIHAAWPWPANRSDRMKRIARIIGEQPGPMVIAGDFNMVPWAASMRLLESRTGTQWVGPARFSFRPGGLQTLLPIDHVLVDAGFEARTRLLPSLGSDHLALWVRIGRKTGP